MVHDSKKNIVAKLKPENRFYPITNIFTSEVSIHTNLIRDLYIVLGEGNSKDGWTVKIYYNPLVIWIWIGTSSWCPNPVETTTGTKERTAMTATRKSAISVLAPVS